MVIRQRYGFSPGLKFSCYILLLILFLYRWGGDS